jgi:hypothetical protein
MNTKITTLEKKFDGKLINLEAFTKIFEPNESGGKDFRYYFSDKDDSEYFENAYEKEDPRPIDYPPKKKNPYAYLDLPYPYIRNGPLKSDHLHS